MSKTHRRSLSEQINNEGFGAAPFHKQPYQAPELDVPETMRMDASSDVRSIQLRAYEIHQEKGGSEIENWLEAERMAGKT